MAVLLFVNLKGGVAKTTNAVAVAECLAAEMEKRVLVIDADHQCTAGDLLLGEDRLLQCEKRRVTLHDLLAAMLDDDFKTPHVANYIVNSASNIKGGLPNLSVLPGSVRSTTSRPTWPRPGGGTTRPKSSSRCTAAGSVR